MDGNYKAYDYEASSDRIKEILEQPSGQFDEVEALPDRDRLTYNNGFYGWCSAVFVDIRDSSGLTDKNQRPTLAKIYRAFISEMVSVLNSHENVREVNIVGDCVWGVYKTPKKADIDGVFGIVSQANTLLKLLNHHYERKGIDPIKIGIGVDYGRVLMVKAGFSGSRINEVVYMGDVVNRASHLAHEAGRGAANPIFIGSIFQQNLNEVNQKLLCPESLGGLGKVYTGNFVRVNMNDWIKGL
ncbi:adenylate/guanylate cyclase domain-containing protein [Corynebacterium glyciniphilum]|uniref:adenylate/guanylate cyclase domain-containing protein n=1 Tax=Corynebacterium glyciniphilum TaxID=1404244 RepID=UPI0011AB6FF1|nr:adenylate/guanylate cyclase domain-containing protein [Corynebacterium glyciniphilum]